MDKAEIEHLICKRVSLAAEKALAEAMKELNATGHRFEAVDETRLQWREPDSEDQLNVWCSVAVNYSKSPPGGRAADPVVEAFLARAQSGKDRTATLLNQLEGGVSNGGFYQTIENQGVAFVQECAVALRSIGAKTTLRIVDQAVEVWCEHQVALKGYAELRKQLSRLDQRFWKLKESIAVLYQRNQSSV